jgi:serine/threonine protein phosphatase PrpC
MLPTISSDSDWDNDPQQSLIRSFLSVDSTFSAKARSKYWNDGSTAIVAAINNTKVFVANAGDCRAIIVQSRGIVVAMSHDHRPDRKDEEARIRRLGGKLTYWGRWRVEGVLAVSRAIGDVELQPYITSQPEVTTKTIDSRDEYLVLASDGLWDVMENEDVAKFIMQNAATTDYLTLAKLLAQEAIRRGTTDNITVLVIDLQKRYNPSGKKNGGPSLASITSPVSSPRSSEASTASAGNGARVLNEIVSPSSENSRIDSAQVHTEFFEDEKDNSEDENFL